MAQKLLFYCPQMTEMMNAMTWKNSEFKPGCIKWHEFEGEWPNSFIENVEEVKNSDIYFFASFDNPTQFFRQVSVLSSLWFYEARTLTVILPFFPTATMERIDRPGEIATAKTLARMLSSIPACAGGLPKILIFDPHSQTLPFYFEKNTVIPISLSAMSLARNGLSYFPRGAAVAFPDAGARKRFGSIFSDYPQIVCDKIRIDGGDEKIVTIKEGDPRGKSILIIDDLTRSGETAEECRKVLVAAGAYSVSAFVTHGAFKKDVWKNYCYLPEEYDRAKHFLDFVITDSCPVQAKIVCGHKPFKVLSLIDLIYKAIKE
jgi:phosphoribosylpyrophosphate synthetase